MSRRNPRSHSIMPFSVVDSAPPPAPPPIAQAPHTKVTTVPIRLVHAKVISHSKDVINGLPKTVQILTTWEMTRKGKTITSKVTRHLKLIGSTYWGKGLGDNSPVMLYEMIDAFGKLINLRGFEGILEGAKVA